MNNSKQKTCILKVVRNSKEHLTAEMVYNLVKEEMPNISLGTVYRNLNKLSEKGFVKKVVTFEDADRFERNLYEHYHLICDKCNKIFDISKDLIKLEEKIEIKTGCKVNKSNLLVNGICNRCLNKEKE